VFVMLTSQVLKGRYYTALSPNVRAGHNCLYF